MNLPNDLRFAHQEWTEDGVESHHGGYMIRECERCGREYVCAKAYILNLCGYYDCKERE